MVHCVDAVYKSMPDTTVHPITATLFLHSSNVSEIVYYEHDCLSLAA